MEPRPGPPGDTGPPVTWPDRLRRSWFPPAAVLGAFAAFAAAALRSRPAAVPPATAAPAPPAPRVIPLQVLSPKAGPPVVARTFERNYTHAATLGGATSAHPFHRSLSGVSVAPDDKVYVLGDDEVRVFDAKGTRVRAWRVRAGTACLEAAPDGRVYAGSLGRVDVYDAEGQVVGGLQAGEGGTPAAITAVRVVGTDVLVADAAARVIRRYDAGGHQLNDIGSQHKTRVFMLPNGWLDFDVSADGTVYATDPGRHRVTTWTLNGAPTGGFGKFGHREPEDFVGCCNPVDLALAPGGEVVTAEKMVARVKVFEPGGRLLALIGPEHFDQQCTHIHLAVDSAGRILAADPVRREVKIFTQGRG